ncbi:MAG: DUF2344 domain-containing protein [Anaerolineae bacterium]|jgi:radical SAM-linked protein|nr:DUF2344 domain-containing protein [Anaerolineae bacterium]MBT7072505.1 DUF2344 domain-containing protein [Anaerolineae bacterium]MBT7989746.1 DUF2344 domain-containing protein [Anaerolineae bacterium]
MIRIRITFSKQGALRYTSHLDLHSLWERSARRANLPLAYSQGFHPQPKIQLAAALALGFTSQAELVDLWLEDDESWQLDSLKEKFQTALPEGIKISQVQEVELRGPPLQTQVHTAEYEVTLLDEIPASLLDEKIATLLAAESILRERRKRRKNKRYTTKKPTFDLRPLILEITPLPAEGENLRLFMRLTAREGATGRPDDVLSEMGIPIEAARVTRTNLVYE